MQFPPHGVFIFVDKRHYNLIGAKEGELIGETFITRAHLSLKDCW